MRLLVIPPFVLGLGACDAVRGAGEDIQAGGDAVQNTARKVRNWLRRGCGSRNEPALKRVGGAVTFERSCLMRIAAVIVALLALSACNTFEGLGRDVESGGEAITGTADDVQDSL